MTSSEPKPEAPPVITGVSRMSDNDRAVLVTFDRALTDDELRAFHDSLSPRAVRVWP